MKFTQNFLIVVFCITFFAGLYGTEEYENMWKKDWNGSEYYGPTNIVNETRQSLIVYGPATIKRSKIVTAMIHGPVKASDSTFDTITINGIANFSKVEANVLNVNGPIYAIDSTFDKISIASNELTLTNSQVNDLYVKKNGNHTPSQTVKLGKGTVIDVLTFEAKNGRVIALDQSVKVNHLSGGTMEFE